MKKIKFYLFFSIFFFLTEIVNACNLKFSNFGSTAESLKLVENNNFPAFPNEFGGSYQIVPINFLCSRVSDLQGTIVNFHYYKNQLIKIDITKLSSETKPLLYKAENQFGKFKRTLALEKKDWVGHHIWKSGDDIILYSATKRQSGYLEKVVIESEKYSNLMSEYYQRLDKK
jgi:hypothetical protein